MLASARGRMTSIRPTEFPEGGFLFIVITQAYKLSPFAPMAPAYHAALSPGADRRYSAISPAFASGVSAAFCSMSGAILPPGIL